MVHFPVSELKISDGVLNHNTGHFSFKQTLNLHMQGKLLNCPNYYTFIDNYYIIHIFNFKINRTFYFIKSKHPQLFLQSLIPRWSL